MNPLRLLGMMAGLLVGSGSSVGVESMLAEVHGTKHECMAASPRPPVPALAQFGRKGGRHSNKTAKPPVPWCTKHYAAPLPGESGPERKARMNVLKRQRKAEAANTKAHNIARANMPAVYLRRERTERRAHEREIQYNQMVARRAAREQGLAT